MKHEVGEVFRSDILVATDMTVIMTIDSPTGHRLELYQRKDGRDYSARAVSMQCRSIRKFMRREQEWLRLQEEIQ